MEPTEPVAERLGTAAASIDAGDPHGVLLEVRASASRRGRRRRAVLGIGVGAALIAGGVVAVGAVNSNGGSDTLSIEGAPDSEDAQAAAEDSDDANGAEASGEGDSEADSSSEQSDDVVIVAPPDAPAGANTVDVIDANVTTFEADALGGAIGSDFVEWLVPWRDGFLAGRMSSSSQTLPDELPEEIIALFPPEVVDFFNGDLPPTVAEATQMLQEAGLLDEVTAVLAEHPEANEAILGAPISESVFEVFFSVDGSGWEQIEFAFPEGIDRLQSVQTVGDRLVAMGQVRPEFDLTERNEFELYESAGEIVVASTTDLNNWDIVDVPAVQRPADLPDIMTYSVFPQTLAANTDGWVLTTSETIDINFEQVTRLLPPEIQDRVGGPGGMSYGLTDDGFEIAFETASAGSYSTVESSDGDVVVVTVQPVETTVGTEPSQELPSLPSSPEAFTITWDEMGVDPDLVDQFVYESSFEIWSASWGGAPVSAEFEGNFGIVASNDGFYNMAQTVQFSSDGLVWSDLTLPQEDVRVHTLLAVDGGVIAFFADLTGTPSVYRVNGSTNTWIPLDIAGLPAALNNVYSGDSRASAAVVVDATPLPVPEPYDIVIESDGYVVTLHEGGLSRSVTLTGPDGTTLLEVDGNDPNIFNWSSTDVEVIDPESDDVLLAVPTQFFNDAYAEQSPEFDYVQQDQDLWVIATANGERWLIDDLVDPDSSDGRYVYGVNAAAINGEIVVVNLGNRWISYNLS